MVLILLENLPYELLVRIAKNLQAKDLCQFALVSKYFRCLIFDDSVWFHLSVHEFPVLDFSKIQVQRSKMMYYDLVIHKNLIGIWQNDPSGVMQIKIAETGLIGQRIKLICGAYGQYPYLVSAGKLKLTWDPEQGAFDRPIAMLSPGGSWIKCFLYFSSNHLLIRESLGSFSPSLTETFHKIPTVLTKSLRKNLIQPGLFVSSGGQVECPLVTVTYTPDMEHMSVKKVSEYSALQLGTESAKVSISKVCDTSVIFENEDLNRFNNSSHTSTREIPSRLDAFSGGVLKRLCPTYKAVYSCLVESTIQPGRTYQNSGYCIILNKDLFTIFNCALGRFRLYFRLESILNN